MMPKRDESPETPVTGAPEVRESVDGLGRLERRDDRGRFTNGNRAAGRPSTRWIRDYLRDVEEGAQQTRQMALLEAIFATAIDRRHRDHVRAAELLIAYVAGRPTVALEFSGADDGRLEVDAMTSEQQHARLAELLAKAAAGAAARAASNRIGAAAGPPEPGSEDRESHGRDREDL